jgi:hypothetical protein
MIRHPFRGLPDGSPANRQPKKTVKYTILPILIAAGFLPLASQAAVIATESFNYTDGSVVGQTGGTGWNYERTDEPGAPAQVASNWNNVFGSHQILSGALVTNNGGVLREFGGITEGTGATSNEREGAFRASGTMFFSTSITVGAMSPEGQNQWAGVSSYDFGTERIFFGMPGQTGATRYFGIAAPGFGADTISTIPVIAGTTYTIVGMLDFDNDLLALWVNPDGGDTTASYDVSMAYNGGNWSSALRFASGTEVTWDDVAVGTSFSDVVVPEPSVSLLAFGSAGLFVFRRRRKA